MIKHVVILCSVNSFEENKNFYIKKTGMSGKGYLFDFIQISKSDYYSALEKLKEMNKKDPLSHLYVIHDYTSGRDFARRVKKTLNKRFKKLLEDIYESKKILIDLRKKSISELYKKEFRDKKEQYYQQQQRVA